MVNLIDLKREISMTVGDKSAEYFRLLRQYFSGRIEKGKLLKLLKNGQTPFIQQSLIKEFT